jgi:hypothetical protein
MLKEYIAFVVVAFAFVVEVVDIACNYKDIARIDYNCSCNSY